MFIVEEKVVVDQNRGCHSIFCEYDVLHYNDSLFSRFGIVKESDLDLAVTKRKAEYLAGRYAAKTVLGRLGLGNHAVHANKHRAPIWPKDITGSISHANSMAVCTIGKLSRVDYVGVDIAKNIPQNKAKKLADLIVNHRESQLIRRSILDDAIAFTLLFSIKESAFKALYPLVGRYFDFHAVEVTDIDLDNAMLPMEIVIPLSTKITPGLQLQGSFELMDSSVSTQVIGNLLMHSI